MSKQIQYIYCPKCGGILKHKIEENNCYSTGFRMPMNFPKCSECNTKYQIEVQTLGTLKIKIKEERGF